MKRRKERERYRTANQMSPGLIPDETGLAQAEGNVFSRGLCAVCEFWAVFLDREFATWPPSLLAGVCKHRAKQVAFWTSGEIFILGSGWWCGGGGINTAIITDVIRELHTLDSQHICSAGIRTSYVLIDIQQHLAGSLE